MVPWEFPNPRLWGNSQSFRIWPTCCADAGAGSPHQWEKPVPRPSNWSTTGLLAQASLRCRGVPAIPGQPSHFLKQVTKGKLSRGQWVLPPSEKVEKPQQRQHAASPQRRVTTEGGFNALRRIYTY